MKHQNFNFQLQNILTNPKQQWGKIVRDSKGSIRTAFRELDVDWKKYNTKDYLFTHDSIVCSVETEDNGYWITKPCEELVNANGNAWKNEVLLSCFRTFIGGDNFQEHIQIPALSKGKILDAIIRPTVHHSKYGDANIYIVDILVATDRKHKTLIERIESGQLKTLSMGCGKEDCKINMADGSYKDIIDIEIGDKVLTHKGRAKKVTKLFSFDVENVPLYKIYANGLYNPLELTGEHPIYIAKSEDVRCYNNRPCKIDKIQKQCKNCDRDKSIYEYPLNFVPISELKVGDYLVKTFETEINDIEELSIEWCRLFGLYMGDGFINWTWHRNEDGSLKSKKHPSSIEFCFNLNETYLKEEVLNLVNIIDNEAKIRVKEIKERNGLYVKVCSRKLAEQFFAFGGEGSHNKKFDERIMKLPKEKQLKIISGMIDTDGCFYQKTKSISWSSSSFALWNQMHLMLLRNKIANLQNAIYRKPGKNGVLFNKNKKSWQYTINISKSNNGAIPSIKNLNYGEKIKDNNEVSFFYKDYYFCPIKKIEKESFTGKVYNFSVEEDNSYLVNNMAVHNCLAELTQCSICGKIIGDDDKNCEHLDNYIGSYYKCEDGKKRIVAELCGALDENGNYIENSCKFIEASWVEHPAFDGAVVNYFVETEEERIARENSQKELEELFNGDIFERLKVADTDSKIALKIAKDYKKTIKYLEIAKRISKKVK